LGALDDLQPVRQQRDSHARETLIVNNIDDVPANIVVKELGGIIELAIDTHATQMNEPAGIKGRVCAPFVQHGGALLHHNRSSNLRCLLHLLWHGRSDGRAAGNQPSHVKLKGFPDGVKRVGDDLRLMNHLPIGRSLPTHPLLLGKWIHRGDAVLLQVIAFPVKVVSDPRLMLRWILGSRKHQCRVRFAEQVFLVELHARKLEFVHIGRYALDRLYHYLSRLVVRAETSWVHELELGTGSQQRPKTCDRFSDEVPSGRVIIIGLNQYGLVQSAASRHRHRHGHVDVALRYCAGAGLAPLQRQGCTW
jgi:hypothetical protein